jgi:uncharacterized protein (TIGR02246 family)
MRRISVFVTTAFLAGLGIGFFARSARTATLERRDTRAADLAAIEKLDRADMEATERQDPSSLTNLWSEDGVNLGFPGPPLVGLKAMQEGYEKFRADHPDFQVLKYASDIKDVQIADGWAIEVGYFEGTYKMSAKDNPVTIQGEGMRVLKRQSDGSWKFALVGLE